MDGKVHEEISERVLTRDGFSAAAITIINNSNTHQDDIPYEAWYHFDRVPPANDSEAFDSAIGYFRTELGRVTQAAQAGETKRALEGIGRLLHAIQDFCSHSNFVELPDVSQQEIRSCLLNLSHAAVTRLKLTGYDPRTPSESPPRDSYPHSLCNKDGPNSRLHEQAKLAAVSICSDVIAMIRGKVSADEWGALKTYSG